MKKLLFVLATAALASCASKEEQKKQSEEEGNFLVAKESRFVKGIGDALKDEGKVAAESVSEGVGEVFKGFDKGFDKSLTKITVKANDDVSTYIKLGRTAKHYNDTTLKTDVIIYAIFEKDFSGKLLLKAFDKENTELGRKTLEIKKKADDVEYLSFQFDERTPLSLADTYTLEIKK